MELEMYTGAAVRKVMEVKETLKRKMMRDPDIGTSHE